MATIWKEQFDPVRHHDRMWAVLVTPSPDPNLVPQWVYFVRVCAFTFAFHSLHQIAACLHYYSQKIHPSSRLPVYTENLGGDHMETQRWFERLPMYLFEEPKRRKVVKALTDALVRLRK